MPASDEPATRPSDRMILGMADISIRKRPASV